MTGCDRTTHDHAALGLTAGILHRPVLWQPYSAHARIWTRLIWNTNKKVMTFPNIYCAKSWAGPTSQVQWECMSKTSYLVINFNFVNYQILNTLCLGNSQLCTSSLWRQHTAHCTQKEFYWLNTYIHTYRAEGNISSKKSCVMADIK